MKCVLCDREAVIKITHQNRYLCEKHFTDYFEKKFFKIIKKYSFLKDENSGRLHRKILVATSGGKDSQTVAYLLAKNHFEPDLFFVDLGIEGFSESSRSAVERLAERFSLNLRVFVLKEEIGFSVPEMAEITGRVPCSACGLVKRYWINRFAYENGYEVVFTGHNLDDEVASLLGNIMNWSVKYLPRGGLRGTVDHPKLVKRAKPLALFSSEEVKLYADIRDVPYTEARCPLGRDGVRKDYVEVLNSLEERHPGVKIRFYMGYNKNIDLFQSMQKNPLRECDRCGMPTRLEVCAYCSLMEELRSKSIKEFRG